MTLMTIIIKDQSDEFVILVSAKGMAKKVSLSLSIYIYIYYLYAYT